MENLNDYVLPIPIGIIKQLEFYTIDDKSANTIKSIDINKTEVYNPDKSPVEYGLASTKMAAWGNYNCNTCGNKSDKCVGHSGRIQLNTMIISPFMFKVVLNFLRIICHHCHKVFNRTLKLNKTSISNMKCKHCEYNNPKVKQSKYTMCFDFTDNKVTTVKIPKEVFHIIDGITDETLLGLGIPVESHPRKYFLTGLMVVSISTRPPVKIPGKERYNINETTSYYIKIILANERISKIDATKNEKERLNEYNKFFSIIFNSITNSSKNANLNITISGSKNEKSNSILSKFQTKTGLIRFAALGKTIRECARTIITLDPTIPVDHLVVPFYIATINTKAEVVQSYNIEKLQIYMNNAFNGKYPACRQLIKKSNGNSYKIYPGQNKHILEFGDIIYRDLIDGDNILFNRQPTLNMGSIQQHKIIVCQDPDMKSFKMNDKACGPYNADFDGDAMNSFNVTSAAGMAEIRVLCKMSNQLISLGNGSSQIKHIQDAIIGGTLLTVSTRYEKTNEMAYYLREFTRGEVMNLFANNIFIPSLLNQPLDKKYNGYQIFSMMFPKKIYINEKTKYYDSVFEPYVNYSETDKITKIIDGKMESGVHDSSAMIIYRTIANEYNMDTAMNYIFNSHQVCLRSLNYFGFSLGFSNLVKSEKMIKETQETTDRLIVNSYLFAKRLLTTGIIAPLGKTPMEFYEMMQQNELVDDYKNAIMNNLSEENRLILLQTFSGSSGDMINVIKLFGSSGQTNHKGTRMPQNLSIGRTSCYSRRFDLSPESRGFIRNGIVDGINTEEFFSQSVSARFDLIDKTQNVSVAGANSRILVKNFEVITMNMYGQCVQSDGRIIQQLYGNDGFDVRYGERIIIKSIMISDEELINEYKPKSKFADKYESTDEEFMRIKSDRNYLRSAFLRIETINQDDKISDKLSAPINVFRLMEDSIKNSYDILHEYEVDENELDEMRKQVSLFVETLPYIYTNENQAKKHAPIPIYFKTGITMIIASIHAYLYTKNLRRLSLNVLNGLLQVILMRLRNALLDIYCPIGAITALFACAPITQLSLNSIHIKSDAKSKTADMTTIKEYFLLSKVSKCRNPRMVISLLPGVNINKANEIANNIESLYFKLFVDRYDIISEKFGKATTKIFTNDQKYIDDFLEYSLFQPPNDLLHWCIRFKINIYSMVMKNITMETIVNALANENLFIVHTSDSNNDNNIFIRIYLRNIIKETRLLDIKHLADTIMNKIVRGVNGITSAKSYSQNVSTIQADGSIKNSEIIKIYTDGINMIGIYNLQLRIKEINYNDIICDNIPEVEKFFGIGPTRLLATFEAKRILSGINYRHYTLIADLIVSTGKATQIYNNGPNIRNSDILLRMGNRAPIKVMEEAVLHNKKSYIRGITGSLVAGMYPDIGSTSMQTLINKDFVEKHLLEEAKKKDNDFKKRTSMI